MVSLEPLLAYKSFNINCFANIPCYEWNFKIEIDSNPFYIEANETTGHLHSLWGFLESICAGQKQSFYYTDQEGPEAFLIAREIDADNVKLSLFSQGWYEPKKDGKYKKIYFNEFKFYFNISISKKVLISSFYSALIESFKNKKGSDFNTYPDCTGIQINSEIVIDYLKNTQ